MWLKVLGEISLKQFLLKNKNFKIPYNQKIRAFPMPFSNKLFIIKFKYYEIYNFLIKGLRKEEKKYYKTKWENYFCVMRILRNQLHSGLTIYYMT